MWSTMVTSFLGSPSLGMRGFERRKSCPRCMNGIPCARMNSAAASLSIFTLSSREKCFALMESLSQRV